MENRDFFEKLKRWSLRKHRLLGKYLPPYSAKVARTTPSREIYVVDGFAGAAVYDDGSKGSPLLIAEFGDICSGWQTPVVLKLINVEEDAKNEGIFDSLERETDRWVATGRVTNVRGSFDECIPQILSIIREAPALFFIDPFGPTDLRFETLRPILTRESRVTELIINFDQDGLRRIVDAALSPNTDAKTAETNARNISGIVGSNAWRTQIEGKGLASSQAEQILLGQYCSNLAYFGFSVVAYPIREALSATPKYYFIYCTRHTDGLLLMNDFVREEEDQIYGEHVEDKLPLFANKSSSDHEIDIRRQRLSEIVAKYVINTESFTRGQLKNYMVAEYFGQFHTKDYNSVVQDLLNRGSIRTTSGKVRVNDQELLYKV